MIYLSENLVLWLALTWQNPKLETCRNETQRDLPMTLPTARPWLVRLQPAVLSVGLLLVGNAAQAQVDETLDQWRLSLGYQHYSEPDMRLQGPELGLHWRRPSPHSLNFEADALVGVQNYSSAISGRLNDVLNIDTRWRVLQPSSAWPQWSYGLALHTHFNDLSGTTSLGYGGYQRISAQIWLPVRWRLQTEQAWEIDAGALLWGQHVSRLSQVGRGNSDVSNVQRSGVYLQASTTVESSYGPLTPYLRWAWVGDSDEKVVQLSGLRQRVYEPRNNRVDVGVQWRFR